MANYDQIVALKEKIEMDLGHVDILINNAGLLPKISLLEGSSDDIFRIINVNLVSHLWVFNSLHPYVKSKTLQKEKSISFFFF